MRHSVTQRSIDTGLPALPGGFECFEHIGIYAHIQGGALHGGGGSAPASFDVGLLPIGGHGDGIFGVIGATGGCAGNGRTLTRFQSVPLG